jgi:uncharacterized protein YeaO (DUF488 family)
MPGEYRGCSDDVRPVQFFLESMCGVSGGGLMAIRTKRVYDPREDADGVRVLVDRLWPRGFTKERLQADLWLKDAAPSDALRKWFHRDFSQWEAFRERYVSELDGRPQVADELVELSRKGTLTLLFAARDAHVNHAVVLNEYLDRKCEGIPEENGKNDRA